MLKKITILSFIILCFFINPAYANEDLRKALHDGNGISYLIINGLTEEDSEEMIYTVKKGDTLYRIALNHQISLEELMEWNHLNDSLIYPGDQLVISEDGIQNNEKIVAGVHTNQSDEKIKTSTNSVMNDQSTTNIYAQSNEIQELEGKEMLVTATAYTAYCEGCSGTTAYGIDLRSNPNQKVIAVDPKVIPLGTKVWVEDYGVAIAGDTGGAIKGNKIDVFIPSHEQAMQWGVKKIKIKILN